MDSRDHGGGRHPDDKYHSGSHDVLGQQASSGAAVPGADVGDNPVLGVVRVRKYVDSFVGLLYSSGIGLSAGLLAGLPGMFTVET